MCDFQKSTVFDVAKHHSNKFLIKKIIMVSEQGEFSIRSDYKINLTS